MRVLFVLLTVFVALLSAEKMTAKDAMGRTVVFDKPAKKVAYLNFYEVIPFLGLWNDTVALTRFAYDNTLMKASNPNISKIPSIGSGTDVNVELLTKLKPDVIVTWDSKPDMVNFMASKGLKVLAFAPKTIDEVYRDIKTQALVIGKPKAGDKAIAASQKLLSFVKSKTKKITKPKTVVYLWGRPSQIAGGIGVSSDMLKIIGVKNPGASSAITNPEVGLEKIVKYNPDTILIWGSAKYSAEDILNNPQWQTVKAVKNKQVFKLPAWGTWSPRVASMTLLAASKIYPQEFSDVNVEAEITKFNLEVFGVDAR